MRILHTSDWHLGRAFGPVSLHDHQVAFLDWLVGTVRDEAIDLVIVAGDVFDRAIAPNESLTLFRDTLRRLVAHSKVAVITGNHDGADRVNTYGDLLDLSGVFLRGGYESVGEVITLDMPDGHVDLVLLPFLDPQAAPNDFGGDEDDGADIERRLRRTHHSVLATAAGRAARELRSPRSVAVAHAFVAGGLESESERQLSVGGTSVVQSSVFEPFSYTALGHLHRPQSIGSTVRYSGTPLAYSFSENHAKTVTVVDLAADGSCAITEVPVPVGRPVLTITGTIDELLTASPSPAEVESFVRAIVTDSGAVLDAKARLAVVYPHIVEITLQPALSERPGGVIAGHERTVLRATQVADRFWESVTGVGVTPDEQRVLHAAILSAEAAIDGRVG